MSNRIFETRLYDMFLAEEILESKIYKAAALDKKRIRCSKKRISVKQVQIDEKVIIEAVV